MTLFFFLAITQTKNLCKYCVHMYVNGEIIPVETIPGTGGDKGEWRRG
jgi:hypothetical protein